MAGQPGNTSCGTEDFESIPSSASNYTVRTWTNNAITWNATDARTDQAITGATIPNVGGKAITIQNGSLTSTSISGGIQSLTITPQLRFSGNSSVLNLKINGTLVGTIPYSATASAVTINNINVSGNVIIEITNTVGSNRVVLDGLSWTCYSALGTSDVKKDKSEFTIYPNPVKNNELFVKGENLSKISKAEIYDLSGKLIEVIANPFKNSNKINLKGLTKGNYILKTDRFSTKFLVD